MNAERMAELAAIWGGDLRRWPEAERAAALVLVEARPAETERVLFEARQLDAALDASARPMVSAALRDRVLASAATAGLRARRVLPGLGRLLWIGGVGWAAAACAGLVFGLSLNNTFIADAQADAVLEQGLLSDLDDLEGLG